MRYAIVAACLGQFAATILGGCTSPPRDIEPVRGFQIDRYLGTWHEIARLDHSFERGLSHVTAEYTALGDGDIRVVNRGYDPRTGKWREARGVARFRGAADVGSLKVRFFWPFWGGYHVIALDHDGYGYAMVTGSDRSYLWILAREEELEPAVLNDLLAQAEAWGFQTEKLIFVEQQRMSLPPGDVRGDQLAYVQQQQSDRENTMGKDIGLAFENGKYVLPALPYAQDALEPLYEARTVKLHHGSHHAGYVKGLNATLDKLQEARAAGDFAGITALSRDLAFHGSGHVLHTLFWHSMTPGGADAPEPLAKAMARDFGSVEKAKAQFAAAAKGVEGSGWCVLAHEPLADKLIILQVEKHQNLTVWGVRPLLVCDVWEHAYYLQYANDRGAWVDAFMRLANWPFAAGRLASAAGR